MDAAARKRMDEGTRKALALMGRKPIAKCNECGKRFYTEKAAERAMLGPKGCGKCGGADIESIL